MGYRKSKEKKIMQDIVNFTKQSDNNIFGKRRVERCYKCGHEWVKRLQ